MAIQIHPMIVGQKVPKPTWVKADVTPSDDIVFANQSTITDADHQP